MTVNVDLLVGLATRKPRLLHHFVAKLLVGKKVLANRATKETAASSPEPLFQNK
jgi:hypothetical protein